MARYRKKAWLSLLQKNRNLETNSWVLQEAAGPPLRLVGPPMAVADLVSRIPPSADRAVTGRDKTSWTFPLAVRLPGLGQVRLVVRCPSTELTGTSGVVVTKRGDGNAPRILSRYVQRGPLEPFSQAGKGPLGVEEYRMRHAEAIGHHGCLGGVASSCMPLDCLPPSPINSRLPLKTIGEACRQQAQALIEALILSAHERRQLGQRAADIVAYVFAKQQTGLVQ